MLPAERTESKSHLLVMRFRVYYSVSAELCVGAVSDCAVLHYSTACALPACMPLPPLLRIPPGFA